MKYGKLVRIPKIEDAEDCIKAAIDLGFNTCQLVYKPEKYDLEDAKIISDVCKKYDMNLLFETGGESPITLLRLIEDVGTGNLFINLDPANILVYGYGNPVDAIDVFGKYVRNIHGKDGCVPVLKFCVPACHRFSVCIKENAFEIITVLLHCINHRFGLKVILISDSYTHL